MTSNSSKTDLPRNISNRAYSTQFSDHDVFKTNYKKLNKLYTYENDRREQRIRLRPDYQSGTSGSQTETTVGTDFSRGEKTLVQKAYRHTYGFRGPKRDPLLESYIVSAIPGSLAHTPGTISATSVTDSDTQAKKRYSRESPIIPRNLARLWSYSGQSFARRMGLHKTEPFSRTVLRDPKSAIEILTKNTSAGYPYFGKRKSDKGVIKDVKRWIFNLFRRPNFFKFITKNHSKTFDDFDCTNVHPLIRMPMYIAHRFQVFVNRDASFSEFKIRQVWIVPFRIVVLEAMFFDNLIQRVKHRALRDNTPIYPIGLLNSQIGSRCILNLRRKAKAGNQKIWSGDYSKFDSTIPLFFLDMYFSIAESNLIMDSMERLIFTFLRFYLKYTPYVDKDHVEFMRRGIPSGAYITNNFDTFVNGTVWTFAHILRNFYPDVAYDIVYNFKNISDFTFDVDKIEDLYIDMDYVHIYGDDSTACMDEFHSLLMIEVAKSVGLVLTFKEPANYDDEEVFFLGRYWDTLGLPFQTHHYMSYHIVYRTSWYREERLKFDIKSRLKLYRILSICLPLRGGLEYLKTVYGEWKPFKDWYNNREPMFLLKDYPSEEFLQKSFYEAIDLNSY
jgi:hypothetical protein